MMEHDTVRAARLRAMFGILFRRALMTVGLTVAALVASAGFAAAADDVNSYTPVTGVERLPNPQELTDHSGVALTPSGTILTVDNDEDLVVEYLPNGANGWTLGRIFDLGEKCEGEGDDEVCTSPISDPIYDLEDITWMGGDKYGLIDEWDNTLSVIRIPNQGIDVTELYSIDLWPWVDNFGGNGIEGLAYSFDESVPGTDTFYVASESNAMLVRLDFDSVTGAFKFRGPDIRLQIQTASAVHDVQGDDTFYVVSNRARALFRFDKSGVQLGPARPLNFINPEGLTMSPDLSRMIVVGEAFGGNEIQDFVAGAPTGSQTAYAQTGSTTDDAIENDGRVTTSTALLLGADGSEVAGLRFTNMCIPANASVASARLAFFAADVNFDPAELTVRGVRGPDTGAFREGPTTDISDRPATVSSVTSATAFWASPFRQYLPDLTPVVDELVGQSGRGECDPITLQLTGTGLRSAISYELDPSRAPSLVIDWSPGPEPAPLDVSVNSSCLAGRGRVDITVSNPLAADQNATVSLSGLPARTVNVPASDEVTSTFTGRANGRYLVDVSSNGATNTNEVVVASCEPPVRLESQCLGENGLFRVRVSNTAPRQARFTVDITGLAPRIRDVGPGLNAMVGVSGRPDGEYDVSVVRTVSGSPENVVIFQETVTVACDPPPPAGEVDVLISCLSTNGLVTVILHNVNDETAEYGVTFGALAERTRTLAPGQVTRVAISGRPDGATLLTVRRDGATVRQLSVFINCDQIG